MTDAREFADDETEADYEDKFIGCLASLDIDPLDDDFYGSSAAKALARRIIEQPVLRSQELTTVAVQARAAYVEHIGIEYAVLAQSVIIGLLHAYGDDKARLLADAQALGDSATPIKTVQGATLVAAAVRLLVRDEVVPEDVISATLDYLPQGDILNPLRQRLLVVQDYLEERQTVLDNLVAYGEDPSPRLLKVDERNVARLLDDDTVLRTVAIAFYVYAARPDALGAMALAHNDDDHTEIICGAMLGAHLGVRVVGDEVQAEQDFSRICELAQKLNEAARTRPSLPPKF